MKIRKCAALIKSSGVCDVIHIAPDQLWIGCKSAIYAADGLPWNLSEDQVCTVLDFSAKERDKVLLRERSFEDANECGALSLCAQCDGDMDTSIMGLKVCYLEKTVTAASCEDGTLLFFDEALLVPIAERIELNPYAAICARRSANGSLYLIVKDGMEVVAAIQPEDTLSDGFMTALSEFYALCVTEYDRTREAPEDGV
ncbi:MAG: hypothetical protein LIO54_03535 [Oscillospiraceae bacterium]|nr:hypothetical protein [Oscillospiraceae bacterium]